MNTRQVVVFRNLRLTRDRFYRCDIGREIDRGTAQVQAADLLQVAIVNVEGLELQPALEYAYMRTNSIDSPWWENSDVALTFEHEQLTFEGDRPTHSDIQRFTESMNQQENPPFIGSDIFRSTEVGDVFCLDGQHWIVAICRFKPQGVQADAQT